MKRNSSSIEFTAVSLVSIALILTVLNYFSEQIEDSNVSPILIVLLGATVFQWIFQLLLFVYKKFIWRLIHYKTCVHGNWDYYYVHDKKKGDKNDVKAADRDNYDTEGSVREGRSQFEDTMSSFSASGNSFTNEGITKGLGKTKWHSKTYNLIDNELSFIANISNAKGDGECVFNLNIITPPTYLRRIKMFRINMPVVSLNTPSVMIGRYSYIVNQANIVRGEVTFFKPDRIDDLMNIIERNPQVLEVLEKSLLNKELNRLSRNKI